MGTMLSGRVFSSFGLHEVWLGDLVTGSSFRTSLTTQAGFDIGQFPGFAVNSGRQKSPVLKQARDKSGGLNKLQISQHGSIFDILLLFLRNFLQRE